MKLNKQQALALGALRYNAESPCPRGHWGYRYTDTDECASCLRGRAAADTPSLRLKQRRYKQLEITKVAFRIHPDDVDSVVQFIKARNDARERQKFGNIAKVEYIKCASK